MHQSAMCAQLDQTFWPLTTHSSPSRTARVFAPGKVGPAAGLGEALAPDLLAGQQRREIALLLLVAAPGDDRRAGHAEPDAADVVRRTDSRGLLEEDALERVRRPAAAVLLRPGQADVAGVVQRAAPRPGFCLVLPTDRRRRGWSSRRAARRSTSRAASHEMPPRRGCPGSPCRPPCASECRSVHSSRHDNHTCDRSDRFQPAAPCRGGLGAGRGRLNPDLRRRDASAARALAARTRRLSQGLRDAGLQTGGAGHRLHVQLRRGRADLQRGLAGRRRHDPGAVPPQ